MIVIVADFIGILTMPRTAERLRISLIGEPHVWRAVLKALGRKPNGLSIDWVGFGWARYRVLADATRKA